MRPSPTFEKGHPRFGGRKPGSVNKTTALVKAALAEAFDRMGGIDALVDWGKKFPTEFYKLWVKLLPAQITGEDGGPIRFSREDFAKLNNDELLAFYGSVRRIADRVGDGELTAAGSN